MADEQTTQQKKGTNKTVVIVFFILSVALVLITLIAAIAWVYSPQEFTFKFETDQKTLDMINQTTERIEAMQEKSCMDFSEELTNLREELINGL